MEIFMKKANKHEKILNITIGEMQIKVKTSYHLIPVRMAIIKRTQITNVGKYVEKRKPMFTVGKNINCYSHYGKQFGHSSKTKNRSII